MMHRKRIVRYIRRMRENGEKLNSKPRITLSTIHGVKGGEQDNVVLLTDLSRNTQRNYEQNPDDENRLFYVGATRTKNHLHIIRPKTYTKDIKYENRRSVTTSKELIAGPRAKTYGDKIRNHANIAKLWTAYLDKEITAHDAAVMMALLKVARTKFGQPTEDTYVDAAAYMAIAGECKHEDKEDWVEDIKNGRNKMKIPYLNHKQSGYHQQTFLI